MCSSTGEETYSVVLVIDLKCFIITFGLFFTLIQEQFFVYRGPHRIT